MSCLLLLFQLFSFFFSDYFHQFLQADDLLTWLLDPPYLYLVLDFPLHDRFVTSDVVVAAVVRVLWNEQVQKAALFHSYYLVNIVRIRVDDRHPLLGGSERLFSDSVDWVEKNVFAKGLEVIWVDGPDLNVASDDPRNPIHSGMIMPAKIFALGYHQEGESKLRACLDNNGRNIR